MTLGCKKTFIPKDGSQGSFLFALMAGISPLLCIKRAEFDKDKFTAGFPMETGAFYTERGKSMFKKVCMLVLCLQLAVGLSACVTTGAASRSVSAQTSPTGSEASVLLTEQAAIDIALKHAGLSGDQVQWLRVEYETDDGIPQYEVEFHHGSWEYDYEIQAQTGDILSYHREE